MSIKTMIQQTDTRFFTTRSGSRLAYTQHDGSGPLVLWLGGFLSDRKGSKAMALEAAAVENAWAYLSFDYHAHGESEGKWGETAFGRWKADMIDVVDGLTHGPLVAIGSSMGGWLAAHLLLERPERVTAAGFLAPAPDFTHELMLKNLDPEARHELTRTGALTLKGYDRPVSLSQAFFDEAEAHLVLGKLIPFKGKVHILHGIKDDVVPWEHGMRLLKALTADEVTMSLIKDGDHRLSRPQDIASLIALVADLRASA